MIQLSTREKSWLVMLFALFTAIYTAWTQFRFPLGQGDNAFLAQMLERMVQTGRPLTQVAEAVKHLFMGFEPLILTTPSEQFCKLHLVGPGAAEFNFFKFHPYVVLYFYLPLVKVFGAVFTLSLLTSISYWMANFSAYVLLRSQGLSILSSSLVGLLVSLHPVWAGGILGQFYCDRLWIGPASVFCSLLFTRQFDSKWILPLAIHLTLTSERMGLIAGALLFGSIILADYRHPLVWLKNYRLILIALGCVIFSVVMVRVFNQHPHYESFKRTFKPQMILANFQNPVFQDRLTTFALVNFIAWGIPALGFWRGCLLVLGVMIPNIFGDLGGAEKTGFFTHYHSLYFPVLMTTLCLSFAKIYHLKIKWLPFVTLAWLVVGAFGFNLLTNRFDFSFTELASRSFSYPFKNYDNERAQIALRTDVSQYLDQYPGSSVSTPEFMMSLLYPKHTVAYYPLGVDDSDFVIVNRVGPPLLYTGAGSFLGQNVTDQMNRCLTARLTGPGYRVAKDFALWTVLERVKPQ